MRRHLPPAARTAVLTAVAVVLLPAIIEAIYVSPTAVFMDERSGSAQVAIGNSGDSPEEATVELRFGFPDADSAGTPYIRFIDDPGSEFPSAADWIHAFPQRVRLEPRSQQVVRLLARPPENLPDGEYWTRMIITGRGATLRPTGADSGVHAGVDLVIRLVTSVTYRKGKVSTGILVRDVIADVEGDSLTVWAHLDRTGNAAYLGTADVELANARGATVRHWSSALSVYTPMRRRFSFKVDSLEAGDYKVRLRIRAERPDLPADRVLPAPTVTDSVAVRVG
jgi:hypothetical protein